MLNRYALLVGIDLYLNDGSRSKPNGQKLVLNNLGGCVNDTKAVREFLLGKDEFNDISVLTSSSPDSNDGDLAKAVEPEERWPTFSNIKREFDLMHDRANAGDFFFFHYSGHGAQLQRVKESPKGRLKDSSLLTMDFCCGGPAVRGWQLNQWLERLNAKGVQVVVSLDSCHSGGSWRESDVSYRTPNDWPELSNLPIDEHVTAREGSAEPVYRHAELETSWSINPEAFTLMAACGDNERAAEKVLNGKRRGAFTHELLDYLGESSSPVTYRMIRDELAGRLKGQSPEVHGRDRMLFFGSSELSSSTPLAVRIEGDKVSIPAGRAHGVQPGSEFVLFPQSFNTILTVDEVDDFVCKAPISNSAALLLKQHHMAVPSRWHLGEETLRVLVDPVLGLEFQQSLSASLQCRIGSLLDVGQYVQGEENAGALRIEMQGEEIKIHGPKLLIGYDGPVRPLRLRGNDIGILAAETAAPLAHLARFQQVLNLKSQGSSEPAPFVVDIKPANGERAAPYPLDQKFKFVFENTGDESLHFTVMVLGPEFHIEQLYPSKDTPSVVGRSKRAFNFSMSLPTGPQWAQELLHRNHRRDIIRTIVTRGRPVSWKSLELPNVWDASQMGLREHLFSQRDAVLELDSDGDWWVYDKEILTSQAVTEARSVPSLDTTNIQDARVIAKKDVEQSEIKFERLRGKERKFKRAMAVLSRKMQLLESKDLTQKAQGAIDETPPGHQDRARRLNSLANQLGDRYARTGAMVDLEEAIRLSQEAVNITPSNHPDRARWLNTLGARLGDRYSRTGLVADLEEAIRILQEAVSETLIDSPDRPTHLNNLGDRLNDRYSRTGAMADLGEAIRLSQEAVDMTASNHPDRARWLNSLGTRLGERYSRTKAINDLEDAICQVQEAINANQPGQIDKTNLFSSCGIRFDTFDSLTVADRQRASYIIRQAFSPTVLQHPDQAVWRINLGNLLGDRYSHDGDTADLERAMCAIGDTIATTPYHLSRAKWHNNLASQNIRRYSSTKSRADLESAIFHIRSAIDGTPLDHPDRATWLVNLGVQLIDRYSYTGAISDVEESKKCLVQALDSSISSFSIRVSAGHCYLLTPYILDDPQAYTIAETTNNLIPLLTPQSLKNSDKQHLLSEAVGISSDAAAIALHINKGPLAAIECLETGRGIIAGALFKDHEITILQRHHPDIAKTFIDSRALLDRPITQHLDNDAENSARIAETEGGHRRDAEQRLLRDLETIRSMSGFERFLLPASEAEMLDAASHGPIVILNVSQHRCDALIVEQSGIRLLKLPNLSQEVIDYHAYDLDSIETLIWLWDDIVCPVLDDLGFTTCPSGSQLPRVWWIPTGKLTKFPLHAAGHHFKGTKETALDRVISSYASSIKAIIHSRRQQYQGLGETESLTLTTVAMNETKAQTPLLHASREVDAVLAVLESPTLQHTQPLPYRNDVLTALKTCNIFHFAGHGYTHVLQPLQSTLLLEDWEQSPLTVENLLETDLSSPPPFLAYLSACGTGQIQHEKSVDESIHIANACQLAGFRHVIGTLWSVDDELCVSVARMTYEFLRDNSMRDEYVSQGLHHATKILRDQWVDSNDDNAANMEVGNKRNGIILRFREARHAQLDDAPVITRPFWVPYVHFGV